MSMTSREHDNADGYYGSDEPLYCRECHGYLGEYETADPAQVIFYNGWSWCLDHGKEMLRLAQAPPDQFEQVRR